MNGNSLVDWINDHRKELLIAGGSAVIVGGAIWIFKDMKIASLKETISYQVDVIIDALDEIDYLKSVCVTKDAAHIELASDALRHGSSMGAQEMVAWREAIKAA